MDMKCYEFKDGRRIFRWLYISLALSSLSSIILWLKNDIFNSDLLNDSMISDSYVVIIFYLIMAYIIYIKTKSNIYIDDSKVKIKSETYFMTITEIKATSVILIVSDNKTEVIKLIDLDRNYDMYKELLEQILNKVDKNVAQSAGSAEELLKKAKANLECKYKIRKRDDEKVELGGGLIFVNVMAYILAVGGVFSVFPVIISLATGRVHIDDITLMVRTVCNVSISIWLIILLHRRKNNVKYALAALPLSTVILTVFNSVNNIIKGTGSAYIFLVVAGMIISIISSLLMAKIYIEYIDTFERPKQTLIN